MLLYATIVFVLLVWSVLMTLGVYALSGQVAVLEARLKALRARDPFADV
jgi:hypothetical protein